MVGGYSGFTISNIVFLCEIEVNKPIHHESLVKSLITNIKVFQIFYCYIMVKPSQLILYFGGFHKVIVQKDSSIKDT